MGKPATLPMRSLGFGRGARDRERTQRKKGNLREGKMEWRSNDRRKRHNQWRRQGLVQVVWGPEVPQWGSGAESGKGVWDEIPQKLKQFADIVHRLWLQIQSKCEHFAQFTLTIVFRRLNPLGHSHNVPYEHFFVPRWQCQRICWSFSNYSNTLLLLYTGQLVPSWGFVLCRWTVSRTLLSMRCCLLDEHSLSSYR